MSYPTKLWEVFENLIKKNIHYIFSRSTTLLCSIEHQVRDPDDIRLQNLDSLVCLESQPLVLPHKVQCNPAISLGSNQQQNLEFVKKNYCPHLASNAVPPSAKSKSRSLTLLQTVLRSEGGPMLSGDCVAFAAASYVEKKHF